MVRASDITPTIPGGIHTVGGKDYGFACAQTSDLFTSNCVNVLDNVFTSAGKSGMIGIVVIILILFMFITVL